MFLNVKILIIAISGNFKLPSNVMLVASRNRKKFVFNRENFSQSVKWVQDSDLNYYSRRKGNNGTIWTKLMKNLLPILIISATFVVSPAHAGSCGTGVHAHIPQEMASKYFDQMDANGDDIVTKTEFEASPMSKAVKSFDALNPDESGVVKKNTFIENFVKAHPVPKNEV